MEASTAPTKPTASTATTTTLHSITPPLSRSPPAAAAAAAAANSISPSPAPEMESVASSSSIVTRPFLSPPPPKGLSLSGATSISVAPRAPKRSDTCCAAVPASPKEAKLWGGRFEEAVSHAVEKFTESISYDKALYKHDIMGSRAHATMLAHQGLMSASERDSILEGLDEIEKRIEAGEFVWRTDREDVHMNIEAALTDLIGEPAKKLHTARSRNDQVLTDFRLWCRDAVDAIVALIKNLQVWRLSNSDKAKLETQTNEMTL